MRSLLVLIVAIVPAVAAAKPAVAVAPFEGDRGNKVSAAVEKALEREASLVVGTKATGKAMSKLKLKGKLDKGDKKKLRRRLEVDVLVEGKVEDGEVELRVSGKGVRTSRFKVQGKASSPQFRGELKDALAKRLAPDKSDEEDDEPPKKKKRIAEEDDDEADDDDDDGGKVRKKRKKRRRGDDDDDEPAGRHVVTQAAVRGNVGAAFARRGLTYDASGGMGPPRVGTAAPSARVELEVYPAAMDTLKGAAAGFGVYGHFDRAFLLSIDVPGGGNAPIVQQHYAVGVRYRLAFGQSTVAFGIGYAARKYVADRSGLGMNVLDMPDTSYAAVAPNVLARFGVTPTVGVFAGGAFELMLAAGDITEDYGYAKTLAFGIAAGADIAFTPRYGLKLAAELDQVGFSFSKPQRGVSAATDRTIGVTASFEVLY